MLNSFDPWKTHLPAPHDHSGRWRPGQGCIAPGRRAAGLSYTEVVVSLVIVSTVILASVRLFGNLGRSRKHLLDADEGAVLAINLISEIKQANYSDPDGGVVFGPEPDEAPVGRTAFDDVDDYHNLVENPPKDPMGNDYSRYATLTRSVTVEYVEADDFSATSASDQGFKKVTITVSREGDVITEQSYVICDATHGQLDVTSFDFGW